jgi:hypothetical protein
MERTATPGVSESAKHSKRNVRARDYAMTIIKVESLAMMIRERRLFLSGVPVVDSDLAPTKSKSLVFRLRPGILTLAVPSTGGTDHAV